MTRVDIGDGGPPINIPDAWLPDWQTHVRAAVERGRALRAEQSAWRALNWPSGTHSDQWIAEHTGCPIDRVTQLRRLAARNLGYGDLVATGRKILDYPLDGEEDWVRPRTPGPDPNRNPPRRVRIIAAGPTRQEPPCGSSSTTDSQTTPNSSALPTPRNGSGSSGSATPAATSPTDSSPIRPSKPARNARQNNSKPRDSGSATPTTTDGSSTPTSTTNRHAPQSKTNAARNPKPAAKEPENDGTSHSSRIARRNAPVPSRPVKEISTHLPAPNPRSVPRSSVETSIGRLALRNARETAGQP